MDRCWMKLRRHTWRVVGRYWVDEQAMGFAGYDPEGWVDEYVCAECGARKSRFVD